MKKEVWVSQNILNVCAKLFHTLEFFFPLVVLDKVSYLLNKYPISVLFAYSVDIVVESLKNSFLDKMLLSFSSDNTDLK